MQLFTNETIQKIKSKKQLIGFLDQADVEYSRVNDRIEYFKELETLQQELLKFQAWVIKKKKRVVIIFEGRDAAGKGGAIRRFMRYINPRGARVVALAKPTNMERGQWYFRRHVKELPNEGEIVFFDRSWYNRAVVEPVMGFCSQSEYKKFIEEVPKFEKMLHKDGIDIVKLWFSITQEEQSRRFEQRKSDPLKQWKLSPVDIKAQKKWKEYSFYARKMFSATHTKYCPWTLIRTNDKRKARLQSIRYVLSLFDYSKKKNKNSDLKIDRDVVINYHHKLFDQ